MTIDEVIELLKNNAENKTAGRYARVKHHILDWLDELKELRQKNLVQYGGLFVPFDDVTELQREFQKERNRLLEELKRYKDLEENCVNKIIEDIEYGLNYRKDSTTFLCKNGTEIHTDVGYVSDWWDEYVDVLKEEMGVKNEKL